MLTECCQCNKYAFRFWGRYAYCAEHFEHAKAIAPTQHQCPKCKQEQGNQVMWRGDKPCGICQDKNR